MGYRGKGGILPIGFLYFKKSKNIWLWRYYDREGKRHESSTGKSDRQSAIEVARKMANKEMAKRDGLIGVDQGGSSITLVQACVDYFSSVKNDLSDKYQRSKADYLLNKILPFFGEEVMVSQIGAKDINAFRVHLLDQGLQKQTANKVLNTLNQVFKYCAQIGEIDSVPFIKFFSYQKPDIGIVLEKKQIDFILEAAREISPDAERLVALGVFCGLRRSEAIKITWEMVDFKEGVIRFDQKNKKDLPAPIGRAMEILKRDQKKSGHVYTYHGRPVKEIRKTWIAIRDSAAQNIKEHNRTSKKSEMIDLIQPTLRYHDLRHTFATWCYRHFGPAEAMVLTRHSTQEAFSRYVHVQNSSILKQAENAFS
jgi:integrase